MLRNNLLVEAQFSQRKFQFDGRRRHQHRHRRFADHHAARRTLGHYNAQYFDATDPEEPEQPAADRQPDLLRDTGAPAGTSSRWATSGSAASTPAATRSRRRATSSTPTTLTDAAGNPIFDAQGHLIPVFVPGETLHRKLAAGQRRRTERRQPLVLRAGPLVHQQPLVGRPRLPLSSASAAKRPAASSASIPTPGCRGWPLPTT